MENLHFHIKQFHVFLVVLQFFVLLLFSSAYSPPVNKYFINCGSNSSVKVGDPIFVGDINSDSPLVIVGESEAIYDNNPLPDTSPLYQTARIYKKQSHVEFNVTKKENTAEQTDLVAMEDNSTKAILNELTETMHKALAQNKTPMMSSHETFGTQIGIKLDGKNYEGCTHCGNPKHTWDTCFKLHGYPEWWEDLKKNRTTDMRTNAGRAAVASTGIGSPRMSIIMTESPKESGYSHEGDNWSWY